MSGLDRFRRRLDELDEQIARVFGERFEICREVSDYKREHDIAVMQPERIAEVRERYIARGREADVPPDFTLSLFELVIDSTCKMEDDLLHAPATIAKGEES